MQVPIVAIIGRANVGKSTLFNKLISRRTAIVNDTPGVTRDRIYERTEWAGKPVILIDTGGLDIDDKSGIELQVKEQCYVAQEQADIIILVVDNQQGLTPQDEEVVHQVRRSGKPLFVAVNKVDHPSHLKRMYEFNKLGMEKLYPISAEHGSGVYELLEDIDPHLPEAMEGEESGDSIKIAIIGKPNVGKSSLVNKLLKSERCIVSEIPGTTRDAIDTQLIYDDRNFTLVDTAGLRRKGKTTLLLDKFSAIMALKAMDRCDIAVLVLDAQLGATEQDATIAGYALDRGRGFILVVNKWDLKKDRRQSLVDFEEQVRMKMKFLDFAPLLAVSAHTGLGVKRLLPLVNKVYKEYSRDIPTARLNKCIEEAVNKNPMPSYRGKFMNLLYSAQVRNNPPTFRCFVNIPEGIHFSYRRYLINCLRKKFGFSGTPIRLTFSRK